MSAVQMLYAETITSKTASGTGSWTDCAVIAAASFTASKKYLILAIADLEGSGSAAEHHVRLVHGSTPTEFTDADAVFDPGSGADGGFMFSWMYVFTQPGTTEDVKLQIMGEGTNTATCKFSQVVAINLDDFGTENTDYYFNEVTADYTTTTTPTAQAAVTFTPNGTDDWLIIGHVSQGVPSAVADGNDFNCQLYESVGATTEPSIDVEAEDADAGDERRCICLMRVWNAPSNASHTWSVRPFHAGASFTVESTRIIALKLNKFAQHSSAYTSGVVTPASSPTWSNVATASVTPSVTGNWFYWAQVVQDIGSGSAELNFRLQDNNGGSLTSDPNYGDTSPNAPAYDATDDLPAGIFKMKSLTSGASRTLNLDSTTIAGTPDVKYRSIVAFSAELASTGLSATVNQVTETDTSRTVARLKAKSLAQVIETQAAQIITALRKITVSQATESDLTQAVVHLKQKAVSQVAETDVTNPITSIKGVTISQVTETDASRNVTVHKFTAVAQVFETDIAQPVTLAGGNLVLQVFETDSVFSLQRLKVSQVVQAFETDTVQTLIAQKVASLVQVTESDQVFALSSLKQAPISLVVETDTSNPLVASKTYTLGLVLESDTANNIQAIFGLTINQVAELNEALSVLFSKSKLVSEVTETDIALNVAVLLASIITSVVYANTYVIESLSDNSITVEGVSSNASVTEETVGISVG